MEWIYLDHNSTTPLCAEAAAAMAECQATRFGNPASQHGIGRRARQALEDAREGIGNLLGARLSGRNPDRVIFTSGGTEANNLALLGLAGLQQQPALIGEAIVSAIEHPSVSAPVEMLERRGWTIHRLGVTADGMVDVGRFAELLHNHTRSGRQPRFVSVMLANNETGVVQPAGEIARQCAAVNVPMHIDAVQMAGKMPLDFRSLGATSMTVAAHKFHGPVGIGALVVRHESALEPLSFGGFQQAGLRPGTEGVALAAGMHAALAARHRESEARVARMRQLRDALEAGLIGGFPGKIVVNGRLAERLPQTSNLAFVGIDRQALLMALDLAGIACSTGSACASGSSEPSPVLIAMGCSKEVLAGSLRFSLGATTTRQEIDEAVARILKACNAISASRPLSRS